MTDIALVYLHGFSATSEEIRPVPDQLAARLGANLHYTRLTGHGRDGKAMAEATLDLWMRDVAQALAIGRRIGKKVIVVSTSTGGTLATIAASRPEMSEGLAGLVLVSPNYAVQSAGAFLLNQPWARSYLPLLVGKERSFEPRNEGQARWWTTRYPVTALVPMQAGIDLANSVDFEKLTVPALFIYHPDDQVVKSDLTREIAARWGTAAGTATQSVEITTSSDPSNHVLAGDILNPDNTGPMIEKTLEWISTL